MKSILKHFVFTLGLLLLFAQTICAQNLIQMRPQWTKECISLTTNWTILCRIKEVSVTKKTYYDTIYYDTSSVTLDSSGHWVWALIKSPVDGGREDEVDIFVLTDNGKFASLGQNDNHRQCYRFLDEVVMSGQLDNQPVNFVYKTSYDTDEPSPMEEDPIALKCLWNMVFKKHIKSQNPSTLTGEILTKYQMSVKQGLKVIKSRANLMQIRSQLFNHNGQKNACQ